MTYAYEIQTQPTSLVSRIYDYFRQVLGQSAETAQASISALDELDELLAMDDIDLFFDLLG